MNKLNSEENELERLWTQTRNITQKCYNPNCSKNAIRSHIQQQNGSLKEIATHGQIVQLDLSRGGGYRFVRNGIGGGDVLTFWGFCNLCDTKLFKSIEIKDIDYKSYKNQLLFAYRGLLNELYKQEYIIKWYHMIFKSPKVSNEKKNIFKQKEQPLLNSIQYMKELKALIESELSKTNSIFHFLLPKKLKFSYLKLPRFEIVTSAISGGRYGHNLEFNQTIFLNLMPKATALHVIVGQYNNGSHFKLPSFKSMSDKEKMKYISDLIIVTLETWCISIALYQRWQAAKKDTDILSEIHKFQNPEYKAEWSNKIKTVQVNLFD